MCMTKEDFKRNREDLGFSQIELAEQLGISNVYVCQIEKGIKNPSKRLIKSFKLLMENKAK